MTNVAVSAEALLASLMAQAEGRGVDLVTLRGLVEESSKVGARRAVGLYPTPGATRAPRPSPRSGRR